MILPNNVFHADCLVRCSQHFFPLGRFYERTCVIGGALYSYLVPAPYQLCSCFREVKSIALLAIAIEISLYTHFHVMIISVSIKVVLKNKMH